MRVIAGSAKGRRLAVPKNMRVRPTADRVKESIFNILTVLLGDFCGSKVLDFFAGTGNLGIETLSRGAASAVFVDNHRESVEFVKKNVTLTGFEQKCRIIQKDALAAVDFLSRQGETFRLVFLDPPYEKKLAETLLALLSTSPLIDRASIVIAEHSPRENLPVAFGKLHEFDRRAYGDTVVSFFRLATGSNGTEE